MGAPVGHRTAPPPVTSPPVASLGFTAGGSHRISINIHIQRGLWFGSASLIYFAGPAGRPARVLRMSIPYGRWPVTHRPPHAGDSPHRFTAYAAEPVSHRTASPLPPVVR